MASYWVRKPKNSLGKRLLLEGLTGSDTASGHVIFPTSDTLRHIREQVMLCMTYVDCQLRQVALVSPLEAVRGHWSQFEAIWGVRRGCCQNNSSWVSYHSFSSVSTTFPAEMDKQQRAELRSLTQLSCRSEEWCIVGNQSWPIPAT